MNAMVISGVDNWVPVAGVQAADVTVGGTAVGLAALNAKTRKVLVTVEDADVIVTFNGTTPSATNGSLYLRQTVLALSRVMAQRLKAIRSGSTSGRLHVEECEFANGARG